MWCRIRVVLLSVAAVVAVLALEGSAALARRSGLQSPPGEGAASGALVQMLAALPAGERWISFADLAALKAVHGLPPVGFPDPALARRYGDPALSAQEQAGAAFLLDSGSQVPIQGDLADAIRYRRELPEWLGYDPGSVERSIFAIDPREPQAIRGISVLRGPFDAAAIRARVSQLGYQRHPADLGPDLEMFQLPDGFSSPNVLENGLLPERKRLLVGPGLFAASWVPEKMDGVAAAVRGEELPSSAASTEARSLLRLAAVALESAGAPASSSLPGAMLFTYPSICQFNYVCADEWRESSDAPSRFAEELARRPELSSGELALPPYLALGIGYRRGQPQADRWWLFSFVYGDETSAREAAQVLPERVRRSNVVNYPGPLTQAVIPDDAPVVTPGEGGLTTVTMSLRIQESVLGLRYGWADLLALRDLHFLEIGEFRP